MSYYRSKPYKVKDVKAFVVKRYNFKEKEWEYVFFHPFYNCSFMVSEWEKNNRYPYYYFSIKEIQKRFEICRYPKGDYYMNFKYSNNNE